MNEPTNLAPIAEEYKKLYPPIRLADQARLAPLFRMPQKPKSRWTRIGLRIRHWWWRFWACVHDILPGGPSEW